MTITVELGATSSQIGNTQFATVKSFRVLLFDFFAKCPCHRQTDFEYTCECAFSGIVEMLPVLWVKFQKTIKEDVNQTKPKPNRQKIQITM